MTLNLLAPQYRATFVDDNKYKGRAATHLAGLACAIQDSHQEWRPKVSELVAMLPRSEESNGIVAAGMAYGAAKAMMVDYPGPSILLFGAALNVLGSAPNVGLQATIVRAEEVLRAGSLHKDPAIRGVLRAARERASFDMVSQMLRDEFSQGLKASGKYEDAAIADLVPKIVNVTHDVRHKGLIERITWKNIVVEEGGSSTDAGWLHEIDEVIFADDLLRDLATPAQVGCAFRILARVEPQRSHISYRSIHP